MGGAAGKIAAGCSCRESFAAHGPHLTDLAARVMLFTPTRTLCHQALAVMEIIRVLGPISRAELARQSHFKPAALTGLTRYLLDEGLVVECEEPRTTPSSGRPSRLLRINSASKSVLGIDIEPDHK